MSGVLQLDSFESWRGDRNDHRFAPHYVNQATLRQRAYHLSRAYVGQEPWPEALLEDIKKMIRQSVVGVSTVTIEGTTVKFSTVEGLVGFGYGFRLHPTWLRK